MTNLTEQWKKGELPNGWYYVRLIRGEHRIDLYANNEWIDCPDNIIDTVVCEVPSYEECQKLLSDQLAKIEGEEINAELEKENARLKHDVGNLGYKIKNQRKEIERQIAQNAKLKELLSETLDVIEENSRLSEKIGRERVLPRNEGLIKRIKEVLK